MFDLVGRREIVPTVVGKKRLCSHSHRVRVLPQVVRLRYVSVPWCVAAQVGQHRHLFCGRLTAEVIKIIIMSDENGYHDCSFQTLEQELGSNRVTGLTAAQATENLERDGFNKLKQRKPPSFAMLFLIAMMNVIMLMLTASAVASLVIAVSSGKGAEAYIEGIAIFVIVVMNAAIGAASEYKANESLEALSKMTQAQCNVIRDGVQQLIDSTHVVVGDLIVLGVGDIVAADVRYGLSFIIWRSAEGQSSSLGERPADGERDAVDLPGMDKTKGRFSAPPGPH